MHQFIDFFSDWKGTGPCPASSPSALSWPNAPGRWSASTPWRTCSRGSISGLPSTTSEGSAMWPRSLRSSWSRIASTNSQEQVRYSFSGECYKREKEKIIYLFIKPSIYSPCKDKFPYLNIPPHTKISGKVQSIPTIPYPRWGLIFSDPTNSFHKLHKIHSNINRLAATSE